MACCPECDEIFTDNKRRSAGSALTMTESESIYGDRHWQLVLFGGLSLVAPPRTEFELKSDSLTPRGPYVQTPGEATPLV